MLIIFQKKVAISLMLFFLLGPFFGQAQNKELPNIAYEHPWVSFDYFTEMKLDGKKLWMRHSRAILHYDEENPVIFLENYDPNNDDRVSVSYWMDKDKYIWINHDLYEIASFKNKHVIWDDYSFFGTTEFIPAYFYHLYYYLAPMRKKIPVKQSTIHKVKSHEFVTIHNTPYNKYHVKSTSITFSYNSFNQRVKVSDEADWFINAETNIMDSVYCVQYPLDYENRKTIIRIKNVDFSNQQHYIDSVFNFDNVCYRNYGRYDNKNRPPSRSFSENNKVTAAVLDFPLIDLAGASKMIREQEGWVLLNFWNYNCPPCIEHLKGMGHEKDSLGQYFLEGKDVKILAINYTSNNFELMGVVGEKTGTSELLYSAVGMGSVIRIPSMGYYYLVSPDRQIVYETGNLGDYSELLEAKANYEKQHQNE